MQSDLVYILPEFCHHDFFNGWHLYERERADGSRNSDGEWGWLQGPLSCGRVRELCVLMGYADMPEVHYRYGSGEYRKFVDEFARRFPLGLRVRKNRWHGYEPVPLGLDTHPDRQLVLKRSRLYFAHRDGHSYAMLATGVDDAERALEVING
jgi:hypothetical protein